MCIVSPRGGDDGHVWRLTAATEFTRGTPSLRGTIAGTAPYHWDGRFDDIPSLLDDVYTRRMGGPALDAPQKDATRRWVELIPSPQPQPHEDFVVVVRGVKLFNARCASCHSGKLRTNNITQDIGTGRPMQTPPLIGVSARAPFLHDGCANTLEDRFTPKCGGGDKYGFTSDPTPSQIADLVAFLKVI